MSLLDGASGQVARFAANLTSGGAAGNRLLILCYHRVLAEPDPIQPECMDRRVFEDQMDVLARSYKPLNLADAVARLRARRLPRRAVCVTFDDGYADNCEIAMPILLRHGIPATVFVASGMLDGGCMWNDEIAEAVRATSETTLRLPECPELSLASDQDRAAAVKSILWRLRRIPSNERRRQTAQIVAALGAGSTDGIMLTSAQVRELHGNGIEIGAHTVSHPILARLSAADARKEITDSRESLAEIIGSEVHGFAYPNGFPGVDYDSGHVEAVSRAGFSYAVSTANGTSVQGGDVYQLPRFKPWNQARSKFGVKLALQYRLSPSALA